MRSEMKLAFPDLLAPVTLPGAGDPVQSWRWLTGLWTSALQHRGHLDQWFDPTLVSALRARGLRLGPEQCYAPIEPSILGGPMERANFEVTDWRVHVGLMGQMHERLRDQSGLTNGRFVSED
ncbi:MAG: hypothetical protein DMF77_14920 [Acidobacteria bacterium]|nr:MAG: hypothetical protein DMF77_14920 [Acidobacteriota bacterium]